jgi:hypothetical protein
MTRLHPSPLRCIHCSRRHGTAYSESRGAVYLGSCSRCGSWPSLAPRHGIREDWPWIVALTVVGLSALLFGEKLL